MYILVFLKCKSDHVSHPPSVASHALTMKCRLLAVVCEVLGVCRSPAPSLSSAVLPRRHAPVLPLSSAFVFTLTVLLTLEWLAYSCLSSLSSYYFLRIFLTKLSKKLFPAYPLITVCFSILSTYFWLTCLSTSFHKNVVSGRARTLSYSKLYPRRLAHTRPSTDACLLTCKGQSQYSDTLPVLCFIFNVNFFFSMS